MLNRPANENPLPESIMNDLREARDLEPDNPTEDHKIIAQSLHDMLKQYLEWNGIQGYTKDIVAIARYFGAKDHP